MDLKRLLKMWITDYISAGLHASPKSTNSRCPHKIRGNSVFVQCSQLQKAKIGTPTHPMNASRLIGILLIATSLSFSALTDGLPPHGSVF
jgi:hypothetical protein